MDMEERLESLAAWHQDASAADRCAETVSDRLADAWEAEVDYWMEEETPEQARERMTPDESAADDAWADRYAERFVYGREEKRG